MNHIYQVVFAYPSSSLYLCFGGLDLIVAHGQSLNLKADKSLAFFKENKLQTLLKLFANQIAFYALLTQENHVLNILLNVFLQVISPQLPVYIPPPTNFPSRCRAHWGRCRYWRRACRAVGGRRAVGRRATRLRSDTAPRWLGWNWGVLRHFDLDLISSIFTWTLTFNVMQTIDSARIEIVNQVVTKQGDVSLETEMPGGITLWAVIPLPL